MEKDYNWQIRDKLLTIEAELLVLRDILPESNLILVQDHNTYDNVLLEIVLANMRSAIQFSTQNSKRKKIKKN